MLAGAIAVFKPPIARSQQTADHVSILVHFNQSEGPLSPIWNYFGYDEPNFTYAPNGKKLLGELAALNAVPVYVRVHNLLTSGDGSASLKWGSTNVYTEDASGHPVYSWEILDRIFDRFHSTGIKPLVELGSCRKHFRATLNPIVTASLTPQSRESISVGLIAPRITRNGPTLFTSSFAI
ncbi:MAG: hypothetical protein ACLP56_01120 [Candidatus Sulfotelmatobacter sp.]